MIRILLDSSSDCRQEDAFCDYFIPIAINVDGREYLDTVDIDNDGFYDLLQTSGAFPHTSQPSPQTFADVFDQARHDGDEVIYFAPSSALSGTYQCACIARDMVGYEGVRIVDTKAASHIVGMMARHAAALIRKGALVEEIVQKCEQLRSRIRLYVGVDTLEYLRRSGRMSKALAFLGEMTRLRPVITLSREGTAEAIGKCLGRSRAMQFITGKIREARIDPEFPLYTLYTQGLENCEHLEKKLVSLGQRITSRLQIGSTIGAHAGPSVYGVLYVEA